jgi:hypothetical protein
MSRDNRREEPPAIYGEWNAQDWITAAGLFCATAAVVLWKNAHLAVLWDLSYVLDSSTRIALGQLPYRNFPFAHAPLTFLIQAAIIRLTGRVFFYHTLYAAIIGGLGTVVTWRMVLRSMRGRMPNAELAALLLAAPLSVLGIYSILPLPSYDCDCICSVLVALFLFQRLGPSPSATEPGALPFASFWRRVGGHIFPSLTGAALVLPLFFKQNIGLPFLVVAVASVLLLLLVRLLRQEQNAPDIPDTRRLLAVLAGVVASLLAAGLLLHLTVGLGNYLHWTIQFAAQRRLPGLRDMLGVYQEPSLFWMLPCIAAGILLLRGGMGRLQWHSRWSRLLAFVLLAALFLWTLAQLFFSDDADDRADSLLALWPLLLALSIALTLWNLWRRPGIRSVIPLLALAAIHGAFLSQQLWGSTYATWPLLILLIAELIAFAGSCGLENLCELRFFSAGVCSLISATLLICGGLYTFSEERLSYVQLPDEPLHHSTIPALRGMAVAGPYLPNFEQLLRYADANIPYSDGLILLPGEDPFYFATGRVPQFPVLLFDPTTDPYSPEQARAVARARNIRWLIIKRELQIKADPTPDRDALLQALLQDFTLQAQLQGYDIYRRR